MDEATIREWFEDVLNSGMSVEDNEAPFNITTTNTRSFEEAGVMTRDEGLVVKFSDGTKCYLTIKKVG